MKKFALTAAVLGLVLLPFTPAAGLGTLDPARLDIIKQRCSVLQTLIGQLQRSDLVARTNRGREYESTAKQLDALNQRLKNNNISTATLDGPVANFKSMLEAFRAAYVQYDNAITALHQIDCQSKPADFAIQLATTSVMRQEVGAEVARGETFLAAYREAVVALQAQLPDGQKQEGQ